MLLRVWFSFQTRFQRHLTQASQTKVADALLFGLTWPAGRKLACERPNGPRGADKSIYSSVFVGRQNIFTQRSTSFNARNLKRAKLGLSL